MELEKKVSGYNVKDVDLIVKLLDQDSLKFKDGEVIGLDEQIKALRKDKEFLFNEDKPESESDDGDSRFTAFVPNTSQSNGTQAKTSEEEITEYAIRLEGAINLGGRRCRNLTPKREAVDKNGSPIFNDARQGVTASALGLPVTCGSRKAWDYDKALLFTGDFDTAMCGILQNIEYAISEDATLSTITDEKGQPINLFERHLLRNRWKRWTI